MTYVRQMGSLSANIQTVCVQAFLGGLWDGIIHVTEPPERTWGKERGRGRKVKYCGQMSRSECENNPPLTVSCVTWCLKRPILDRTWPFSGSQPLNLMFSWRNLSISNSGRKKRWWVVSDLVRDRRSPCCAPWAILVGFSKVSKALCDLCLQRPACSVCVMK